MHLYRVAQYRDESAHDLAPIAGTAGRRYRGNKQLVIVQSRAPISLAVAEEDRHVVSLMYNEAPFKQGYALSDGTPAVTFAGCGESVTQWSGALVVAGARCVTLVARDQRGVVIARGHIPYGVEHC